MGLEAATHINQLNPLNPVGGADPVAQGDDHIRMVKQVLTADLPNIGGAVTLTHTEINDAARKSVANVLTAALSGASAPIVLSSGAPGIIFRETDGAVNNQYWRTYVGSETFFASAVNDAQSVETVWLQVDRTGTVVDNITLTATQITLNGIAISDFARKSQTNTFTAVLVGAGAYPVLLSSATPFLGFAETDGAANNRLWDFGIVSEQLQFRIINDAFSTSVNWLTVDRTATVVDQITFNAAAFVVNSAVSLGNASGTVSVFDASGALRNRGTQNNQTTNVSYISFQQTGGTENGYCGFGAGTSEVQLKNAIANANVNIIVSGSGRADITTPLLGAPGIHNGTAPTGTVERIASGTYTPTLTGVANVAASTSAVCQWMRVGNVVTVSGRIAVDPTVAAPTTLGVSLPIASNFASNIQCAGTAVRVTTLGGGAPNEAGVIAADAVNDRAEISWIAADPANSTLVFQFTYVVV